MSDRSEATSAEDVAASFHLANRAGYNYVHLRQWELFEKSLANLWTPDHPDGVSVELAVEKSSRLILSSDRVQSQPELSRERPHAQRGCRVLYIGRNLAVAPVHHLTYGSGPKGSPRLIRQALASYLNSSFQPHRAVRHEDILVLSGVTSVIDSLAWSICDEGEGIIIPQLTWPPYIVQEIWAKMLDDKSFTENFLMVNRQRLGDQYAFATRFLDEHGIAYYKNSNAGMFIRIDLRVYLSGAKRIESLSLHRLTPQEKEEYKRRELEAGKRFSANKVAIALGTNFFTKELGCFRPTFTVSRDALEIGLWRMLQTLREIEQLDWESAEGRNLV